MATEVGVIPEDWEARPLNSFNPFITSGSRGWAKYYAENGDAFVRITNLSRHNIYPDLSDLRRVKLPDGENEGTRTGLRNGDILVSITADIGIIGYVDDRIPKPAYINQHIATVRLDPSETDSKFLSYFLASEGSQRRVRATTDAGAKAGMSLTGIGNLLGAFPPTTAEQSAIAEALSDVDRGIAAVEAVIAKKRALKTATMQALLSGTRRLPGFSGAWEVKRLGQLGHFSKGHGINRGQVTATGLPCIRYGEIYTRHNDIVREFHSHIPLSVAEQSKLLTKGDLLFAGSGETAAEIGKCVAFVSDQEAYAGGDIVILSLVTGNPIFFGYLLNSPEIAEQKAKLGQGDAVVHISAGALAQIELKIPPIEEQSAIAAIMVDLDDDLTIQNDKLQKLRHVKTGMMQQLLTGKIRLI